MNHCAAAQPSTNQSALSRVLIADPDEGLLAAYREDFSEEFELTTATSGVECVERLQEQTPNLLVLEPQLPWGGGDGVLAMMRTVPELALVPVLILTSCRDVCVLKGVAPFRISEYCVKPRAPDQLAAMIRLLLNRGNFKPESPL